MSRLVALAPELVLALTALALFAMMPGQGRRAPLIVTAAGGMAALAAALATLGVADEFLYTAYRVDAFSQAVKVVVLAGLVLASLVGGRAARPQPLAEDGFFLVVAALGLVAAASLADTLGLFLALEISSAAMVVLAGLGSLANGHRGWGRLLRTSLAPTALGALGLALLTGATGATRLADITAALTADAAQPAALAGATLVLAGLLVRWGAAPFYAWCPWLMRDPSPLVALFAASALWAGVGAVLVRLVLAFAPSGAPLALLLSAAAAAALGFGVACLTPRRDARCLLSYVSVVQAGLVVTALVVPGLSAGSAALAAVLVVAAAQSAVLLTLIGVGNEGPDLPAPDAGGPAPGPAAAGPYLVGLAALIALPGTAGFVVRRQLFLAPWREGWVVMALAGAAAGALLALLLLREILSVLGVGRPVSVAAPRPGRGALAVAWLLALLLVLAGLAHGPLDRGAAALARLIL